MEIAQEEHARVLWVDSVVFNVHKQYSQGNGSLKFRSYCGSVPLQVSTSAAVAVARKMGVKFWIARIAGARIPEEG